MEADLRNLLQLPTTPGSVLMRVAHSSLSIYMTILPKSRIFKDGVNTYRLLQRM